MKPERWAQVRKILDAALELSPEARAAYVAKVCATDADLHQEVKSFLAAHDRAGLKKARRGIHRLKRQIHKATV